MVDAEGSSTSDAEQAPNAAPQYDQDGYAIDNRPMPPKGSFRYWQRKIWVLLDDPASSTAAKYVSTFLMLTILVSIMSFTIASNPNIWFTDSWINTTTGQLIVGGNYTLLPLPGAHRSDDSTARRASNQLEEGRSPYGELESVCILIFTAEYFTRMVCAPQGPGILRYIFTFANIIDLVSILPWWIELIMKAFQVQPGDLAVLSILRLIRLTRITRIFKMSKNFEGLIMLLRSLIKSGPALLMLFAFMGISGILFATLIYTFEAGVYDPHRKQYVRVDGSASPFESIIGSLWWTIVTMTTVGYGDQYPVTPEGKVIAVLTMFCGLVVLSLPITIIGANFDDEYRALRKRNQEEQERKRREERRQRLRAQKEWQQQQDRAVAEGKVAGGGLLMSTPMKSGGGEADAAAGAPAGASPGGGGSAGGGTAVVAMPGGEPNVLTYPPSSPVVAGAKLSEDPIKLIQTMIHESHYELTRELERMMIEHENQLRKRIKAVLRAHAAGVVDLRSSPLDQQKPLPVEEGEDS